MKTAGNRLRFSCSSGHIWAYDNGFPLPSLSMRKTVRTLNVVKIGCNQPIFTTFFLGGLKGYRTALPFRALWFVESVQ